MHRVVALYNMLQGVLQALATVFVATIRNTYINIMNIND